jgi:hypothetical protein
MSNAVEYKVRLKPRPAKPRKGVPQTPGRYMIDGVRFEEARGWYTLTDEVFVEKLREITHNDKPEREGGILIFDVMTRAEAEAMEKREQRDKTKRSVEASDEQRVARRVHRHEKPSTSGAISTNDVNPSKMQDPAEGTEDANIGAEGDADTSGDSELGKIEGGEQELDDSDDLLEEGGREPRAPVVKPGKAEKAAAAQPQSRRRGR